MTLLQPSETPSRTGINNAISSEDAAHVAAMHADSGWIDVTFRTGFESVAEALRYRRIGHDIYLRGRVGRTGGAAFAAGSTYIIGDLPAGFRPNPLIMFTPAGSSAATSGGRFWITTSGEINLNPQNAPTSVSLACNFLNN